MFVNMPIRVIGRECDKCPRFSVMVEQERNGTEVVDSVLECRNYDDCLMALDVWERSCEIEEKRRNEEAEKRGIRE